MATVLAQMLSGRYRSESLCRHLTRNNSKGYCLFSPSCINLVEDINHILTTCHGLHHIRMKLTKFATNYFKSIPMNIADLIHSLCAPSNPIFWQFLLDCLIILAVIKVNQTIGKVSRMWIYTLNKTMMKHLGRLNFL